MKALIEIALAQYGVKEIEGKSNNRTFVEYAREAGFKNLNFDFTF